MLFTDHLGYRDVLVTNNSASPSDRLAFYAINLEHSMAEANGEFAHAAHVRNSPEQRAYAMDLRNPPAWERRRVSAGYTPVACKPRGF